MLEANEFLNFIKKTKNNICSIWMSCPVKHKITRLYFSDTKLCLDLIVQLRVRIQTKLTNFISFQIEAVTRAQWSVANLS